MNAIVIATAKTAELVAFYNAHNPDAQVKKFSDRATAEKRVQAILDSIKSDEENAPVTSAAIDEGYEVSQNSAAFLFPKAADFLAATNPARLFPEGFSSIFAKPVQTSTAIIPFGWDKVETSTEDEHAATDEAVSETEETEVEDEHEETAEEEAARLAAEADAENGGEADKTAENTARKAKQRSSNSAGVAASWLDKEVAKARLTRDGVSVTLDGVTSYYKSTAEAFRNLRLDFSKHIRFRLKLKASRAEVFEQDGVAYHFAIIEARAE